MNTNMRGVYRSMWWAFGGQTVPASRMTRVRTHPENANSPRAKVTFRKDSPLRLYYDETEDLKP